MAGIPAVPGAGPLSNKAFWWHLCLIAAVKVVCKEAVPALPEQAQEREETP